MMRKAVSTMLLAALMNSNGPAIAQDSVRTIDPNQAIDGDLAPGQRASTTVRTPAPYNPAPSAPAATSSYPAYQAPAANYPAYSQPSDPNAPPLTLDQQQQSTARQGADNVAASSQTFDSPELLAAAEGVFGKGTAGLAGMLEKILKEQGRPNAYIAGREAGGAVFVGLRYGGGQMFHKIEGQMPVHWTGPSVGFDFGGDASKVFVLVYNLYDSEDLYKGRYAAGEGRLFFVGGFAATYLRKGDKVVIPIRLGVGWRQGVNLGYMKFDHKTNWFPF